MEKDTFNEWAEKINYPQFTGAVNEVINKAKNYGLGLDRLQWVFSGLSEYGDELPQEFITGFQLASAKLRNKLGVGCKQECRISRINETIYVCGESTFNGDVFICDDCFKKEGY